MKKKRILLIDDEVGFTRLCKLNLEQKAEYEVRVENWPDRAVSAAREFRPDLVLLDVIMPRMIGHDVAERLRADAHLRATPIVFLSAVGGRKCTDGRDDSGRAVEGYPCIFKPASLEELIDGIERHLPERAPDQDAAAAPDSHLGWGPGRSGACLSL
ncbi:MAG: response regulator [Limisphaerales bacterium]